MNQPNPDDSRIRHYAAENAMHFQWRTTPTPSEWRAEVSMGHIGFVGPCWIGTGPDEQAALDDGIGCAIQYFESTASTGRGASHLKPPTGGGFSGPHIP